MTAEPVTLHRPLDAEDQARADCWAILAALFSAAPDASLLRSLGNAPRLPEASDQPFAVAYNALLGASAAAIPDAVRQEYDDLFIGVGKSEVDPHAAHWRPGSGAQRSLADLRADLAALGLGRRPDTSLYEDHVGALCETMRILIVGQGDRPPSPIAAQRSFFERHLGDWTKDFCNAICSSPLAKYYRQVAQFADCFVAIERDAFVIE